MTCASAKHLPVAKIELSKHLTELSFVDGAAAVLIYFFEQQMHELWKGNSERRAISDVRIKLGTR